MTDALAPDAKRATEFFRWISGGAEIHIEDMASEGKSNLRVRNFGGDEFDELRRYVQAKNADTARRNMYFVPNAEFLDGKRNKKNIKAVRFLHVDLDFKDYQGEEEEQKSRVRALLFDHEVRPNWIPAPTVVWMTGGGYQALWMLEEPMDPSEAEALNKTLLRGLEGGPGTHDVSRLLRVPCTVNWLNDKKRAAGRVPILGTIAVPESFAEPPAGYRATDFNPPEEDPPPKGEKKEKTTKAPHATVLVPLPLPENPVDALPKDEGWQDAIKHGKAPAGKSYASRSELMFGATIWMLSEGVDLGTALAILLTPGLAIGDHIRERHPDSASAQIYAARQVQRAADVLESRDSDWPSTTDKGLPTAHDPENIRHALKRLGITCQRNLFTEEDEIEGGRLEDRDLNDVADILCSTFRRKLMFTASSASIKREVTALAHENQYHPVIDYHDQLKWDGEPRLDTWLINLCGVEDSPLHRAFSAMPLIAAVRRIKHPGCKFDTMLVLEGPQGVGKSSLLRALAVRDAWFCESLNLRSDDRERAQVLARAWIVECPELGGMNKTTSEELKKFLSESIDTYRKPYDKNARQYPRHCIIIGTTNESDYLRDITGNRRFWPVRVGTIDLAGIAAIRDQLWAEAVQREADGESITLSPELWADAETAQKQRLAEDPYADVVAGALGDGPGKISMESVKLLLGIPTPKLTPHDSRRIRAVMEELGWRYGTYRLWVASSRQRKPVRGFSRGDADGNLPEIGVRKAQGGEIEVGLIGPDGAFNASSRGDPSDPDMPF